MDNGGTLIRHLREVSTQVSEIAEFTREVLFVPPREANGRNSFLSELFEGVPWAALFAVSLWHYSKGSIVLLAALLS